jgi:osmotically-inducible protein OsmY
VARQAGNHAETPGARNEGASIPTSISEVKNMNTRMKTLLVAGALIAATSTLSSQAADQAASSPAADQGATPAVAVSPEQRIKSDVEAQLATDPRLSGEIGVQVQGDVVTLTGIVTTTGEADTAALDALSVDGVNNVQNNLRSWVGDDF